MGNKMKNRLKILIAIFRYLMMEFQWIRLKKVNTVSLDPLAIQRIHHTSGNGKTGTIQSPLFTPQSELSSSRKTLTINITGSLGRTGLIFLITVIAVLFHACKTGDSSVNSSNSYVDTTSPTITEISPANGSSTIRGGAITVIFSEEMDPSTLTTNTTDNTCSGTIQVSNDDFTTCIQMAAEPSSDTSNSVFTIKPASVLDRSETYTIKIASTASDIANNRMTIDAMSSFDISHATDLSIHFFETCALMNDGSVYCWGRVLRSTKFWERIVESPEKIEGTSNARQLSVSREKCIIDGDSKVKCWGTCTDEVSIEPRLVQNLNNAVEVASGEFCFACARLDDGTVKCWGNNFFGQLGNGVATIDETDTRHETPVKVGGIEDAVQIQAGYAHACTLHENGTVSCWGNNIEGQTGSPFASSGDAIIQPTPVRVNDLSEVRKISLGDNYACAVLEDGAVKCWGSNAGGQLGSGIAYLNSSYVPITIEGISGAVDIFTGRNHVCALLTDGSTKCWGDNSYSQLGIEDTDSDSIPSTKIELYPVTIPHTSGMTQLATGGHNTCGLYEDHSVKCWGSNSYRQLGEVDITESVLPITIEEL